MIPARLDFPCRTNADYTEEFSVTENDAAVDLTGYSAVLTARLSLTDDVLFTLTNVTSDVQGLYLIEPTEGIISIRIDRETLNAAYNSIVTYAQIGDVINVIYDMQFTTPNGDEEVWFEGVIAIKKGVGA